QLPYNWNGNDYNAGGSYNVTLTSAANCDSIATLNLTINDVLTTDINTQICTGQSYILPDGSTTGTTGVYTFTLTSSAGCDSIVTVNLQVNDVLTSTTDITICDNQLPYNWNGTNYNAAGVYNVTLTSAANCDSVATLNLAISNTLTGTDVQSHCNSYTWIDGITYTSSTNTPTFTITLPNGCDSIVTLDLTINNFVTGTDVQTHCTSYTWIDGITYSASTNTPTYTIVGGSATGCDSIVTLDLTINNTLSGTDVQTHCTSYTWIDGNTYTSSTNTPTFTITLPNGCDSIVTLDLTINNTLSGTDVQTHCNSYTWIDGNTYTSSTNTPTFTITLPNGCDSIVTLDLTINNFVTGTDVQTHCNSYTWIDGITYTSSTNTPTYTITLPNGCDSIVTLDLTINTQLNTDINAQLCAGQNYMLPDGTTTTTSGNYTFDYTTSGGCDSTVTVTLTVNQAPQLNIVTTNTTCGQNNGGLVLTANGATSYQYQWSTGSTTQNLTNLPPASYTVTVTDNNGCTASATTNINGSVGVTLNSTIVTTICGLDTGSVDVTVNSGVGPYSYEWNTGATTQDIANLGAGVYIVTVTDATGCQGIDTSAVTCDAPPPCLLTAGLLTVNATCFNNCNGQLELIINNAVNPVTISWNTGGTGQIQNGLCDGNYSVTVTDANGCTATATANISEPDSLTLNAGVTNVDCNGTSTGAISINASGGTAPYTYQWSNNSTNQNLTDITAAVYSVTVIDANTCTASLTEIISEPNALIYSASGTDENCNQGNATATVNVIGGVQPYSFEWSNGQSGSSINNVNGGVYQVTLTDGNQCTAEINITIDNIAGDTITLSTTSAALCEGSSVDVTATGMQQYTWSPVAGLSNSSGTAVTIYAVQSTTYQVSGTDANGCIDTAYFNLTAHP
ncbi:MAG: beta strand repeat-containing protein, partial [Bacteroidota bacterium]